MPTVAVVGASSDRRKYGNKAVRAYVRQGYTVYPVNPSAATIEGIRTYASVADIPGDVDRVTLYVLPDVGLRILPDIADKKPVELFVNPGAESDELLEEAARLGLNPVMACSILDIGEHPETLS